MNSYVTEGYQLLQVIDDSTVVEDPWPGRVAGRLHDPLLAAQGPLTGLGWRWQVCPGLSGRSLMAEREQPGG